MDQAPPSPEHRHKRRALWASLWLARLIRLLSTFVNIPMPDVWRAAFCKALGLLARLVVFLVLIRADQLKGPGAKQRNPRQILRAMRRHDVRVKERRGMRATIGGELRRAVKARGSDADSLKARAVNLLCVLLTLETWAARAARRMRSGLTRVATSHTGVDLLVPSCRAGARGMMAGLVLAASLASLRAGLAPPLCDST